MQIEKDLQQVFAEKEWRIKYSELKQLKNKVFKKRIYNWLNKKVVECFNSPLEVINDSDIIKKYSIFV